MSLYLSEVATPSLPSAGSIIVYPKADHLLYTLDSNGVERLLASGSVVTSVAGTAPIASSGGTTPTISLNDTVVTPGSYTVGSFTVDQKGRLTAASSGLTLAQSTYTPTLFNTTNLSASTAAVCTYLQLGSMVWVVGKVDITPTSGGGTATLLGMSLPVASNLGAVGDLAGNAASDATGYATGTFVFPVGIKANVANDRASFDFLAYTSSAISLWFNFGYRVI